MRGFYHYPNTAGIGSQPGIPDRTAIAKNGLVIQIEVKKPVGGVQSPKQRLFQINWERNGGYYICGNSLEIINYIEMLRKNGNLD